MTSEILTDIQNQNNQHGSNGSNNRFLNITLLKNNIKQNKIVLIITAIILFFSCPLIELLIRVANASTGYNADSIASSAKSYAEGLSISLKIAVAVLAVILGLTAIKYMHNRRAAVFYNSIPVNRIELFITQFVTGLIYFVPALILNYILSVIFLPYGDAIKVFSETFGIALVLYFLIYSFTIFCANIGGTFINSLFVMAYLSAIIPSVYGVCVAFIQSIFRFTDVYAGFNDTTYQIITMPVTYYVARMFTGDAAVYHILIALLVSVLFAVGACFLNRITKTENAQKTFYFEKFQAVFKYSVLALVSFAVGLIFKTGIEYSFIFSLLGIIIGGFAALLAVNFVIYKNLREVFKGVKPFLIVLAAVSVLTGIFQNDIFGVDKSLPNINNVESITYDRWGSEKYDYSTGLSYGDIPELFKIDSINGSVISYMSRKIEFTDPETIRFAYNVFQAAFKSVSDDTNTAYNTANNTVFSYEYMSTMPMQGNDPINFNLKNGGKISKKLSNYLSFKNEQDLRDYQDAISMLQASAGYKKAYYFPLTDNKIMHKFIDYPNTLYYITLSSLTEERIPQIAEFISRDKIIELIECINKDISGMVDLSVQAQKYRLDINFKHGDTAESNFNLYLTDKFVNTIKYLNDNHLN